MHNVKSNVTNISEARYIVSTDPEAAPYAKYVEEGTSFMPAQRYMRRATKATKRKLPALVSTVDSNRSFIDDDFGDALLKALATHLMERAKEFAPVDTGELAYGVEGKGIHIIEKE